MVAFPDYAPAELQLKLPNYPVLLNLWRAQETPEILGDLPVGAELTLRYRNIPDAETLELLQVWRASGGGISELDPLPASIAAGILDADLANRILAPESVAWVVAEPPKQSSVKSGRSNVDIKLVSEMRVDAAQLFKPVDCAVFTQRSLEDSCTYVPPEPPEPVTGNWFRYANGYQGFERIDGIGGFADTDNSIYAIGINDGTTYRYVGRIDADTATIAWNKRISFSDSATYILSGRNGGNLVDDGDGNVSLFVFKRGTDGSTTRLYRVVLSKADGSYVSCTVAQISESASTNNFPSIVRKAGSNYIACLRNIVVVNPCFGPSLSNAVLVANIAPDMTFNWLRCLGEGVRNVTGDGTIDAAIAPRDDSSQAGGRIPAFFEVDSSYLYIPNPEQGGLWGHGNNYIRADIATGAVVDGADLIQTGPTLTTTNALHSRAVSIDSSGNIYTDAYIESSISGNPSIIQWNNGVVQWRRTYDFGYTLTTTGQKLLERNGKLLVVVMAETTTGRYEVGLCLANISDGSVIAGSGKIISWDGGLIEDIASNNLNIVPMANQSGAIIITQVNTFIRIDVDNLPEAGTYPMSDVGDNWVVTDISVSSFAQSTFTSSVNGDDIRPGCASFTVNGNPMPGLADMSGVVSITNPSVTATVEDNPTFSIDRIGGYYAAP